MQSMHELAEKVDNKADVAECTSGREVSPPDGETSIGSLEESPPPFRTQLDIGINGDTHRRTISHTGQL